MVKKKSRRRGNRFTLPIAIIAPIASNFATRTWPAIKDGRTDLALTRLTVDYTGYDPKENVWEVKYLKYGTLPLVLGAIVHGLASKMGINRAIARSGLPWIRI